MSIISRTEYLDTLPDCTKDITIHHYVDRYPIFPDLSRFYLLHTLNFESNNFASLPTLPQNLKSLHIRYNTGLVAIPKLPANLKTLYICRNINLSYIKEFPETLVELYCIDNKRLTNLPPLPPYLKRIHCGCNQLTSIPELPPNLITLNCNDNQLRTLPKLPDTLKNLCFSDNCIEGIPKIPESLTYLYCNGNPMFDLVDTLDPNNCSQYRNLQKRIERFRFNWYCWKFKRQFRYWLFVRVREKRAMERYHPSQISKWLERGVSIEDLELYL
jgi:hypothetical protein